MSTQQVLVINTGSSSVKFAQYAADADGERLLFSGQFTGIGPPSARPAAAAAATTESAGRFRLQAADGQTLVDEAWTGTDYAEVLARLLAAIAQHFPTASPGAIGHRLVHGGTRYTQPTLLTPDVLADLRTLVPLAPNHLPAALACIEQLARLRPEAVQVGCFDTAFHATIPRHARLYAIPRRYTEAGVLRYGFHGLSYEAIVAQLRAEAHPAVGPAGRLIVAHLGNGVSLAAIRAGECLDTTMGYTPLGGVVMGTRPGDLDPGVVVRLAQDAPSPEQLEALLSYECGLVGLAGTADMRRLLERLAQQDPHASEAVAVFCHAIRKAIGALAVELGGVDWLVFTGGIGEHAPEIRQRIVAGLEFLGPPAVRVIPADEEAVIARHTLTRWRALGPGH
jgi:acetate kinase